MMDTMTNLLVIISHSILTFSIGVIVGGGIAGTIVLLAAAVSSCGDGT